MANWQKFITDFSNFLSSNQSSGPFQTGKKLSEYYVNTIKDAKAIPAGNALNGNLAQSFKPILDLGFGLGFSSYRILRKHSSSYSRIRSISMALIPYLPKKSKNHSKSNLKFRINL